MIVSSQLIILVAFIFIQTREMIGEKKVTKNFEYDLPSDLVLTFLSEVNITHDISKYRYLKLYLNFIIDNLYYHSCDLFD